MRTKQPRPRRSRGGRVPVWSDKAKVARKTAPSSEGKQPYTSDTDSDETDTDMESAIAAVAAANGNEKPNGNAKDGNQ